MQVNKGNRERVGPAKILGRNDFIELLRYVCAVGIVWFHLHGPIEWIGHSALLVFVALSVFFAISRGEPSWRRTLPLKIWIAWCGVYTLMKIAQALISKHPISAEFEAWMLFTGPALPLWFLPFIYVANGFSSQYINSFSKASGWIEAIVLPCLATTCIVLATIWVKVPITQWLLGSSAVFIAITLFRSQTDPKYLAIAVLILAGAMLIYRHQHAGMLVLAFLVTSIAALRPPRWKITMASQLGAISLGMYLLHPGVSAVVTGLLESSHHQLSPIPEIGIVVISSTALAWLLRNSRILGRMI